MRYDSGLALIISLGRLHEVVNARLKRPAVATVLRHNIPPDAIGLGLAISLACLREVVNARLKRKSPTEMLQKRFLHGYTLLEFERDTIAASSLVSRLHRGDREAVRPDERRHS
ncbi:hypothetical protein DBV15_02096 [Temnothorax longispinosus]|uniref:Uncharacterized protein n=1 Tax=Temnothorax longispinosus TaxID=300112 RepID=A0A4S2KKR1_9HYME|nr:hypothetical protein DBV15_02096 [Temnothorax longispinosus]